MVKNVCAHVICEIDHRVTGSKCLSQGYIRCKIDHSVTGSKVYCLKITVYVRQVTESRVDSVLSQGHMHT